METHSDFDHERLKKRAEQMKKNRASEITSGKPREKALLNYEATNGVHVTQFKEDEQQIFRISIGGHDTDPITYCTYRGDPGKCAALLDQAARAIREQFVRKLR